MVATCGYTKKWGAIIKHCLSGLRYIKTKNTLHSLIFHTWDPAHPSWTSGHFLTALFPGVQTAHEMANTNIMGGLSRTFGWLFPRTNMRVLRVALPTSSLAGGMRLGGDSKAKCGERRVPSLADLARLENNTHVLVPWAITNEKLHTEYCGGRETCAPAPQMAAGVSVGAHGAEAASAGNAAGISAGPAEALDSIASADKLEKLSEELTKLREMIAAVVTKQDSFVPMMAGGGEGWRRRHRRRRCSRTLREACRADLPLRRRRCRRLDSCWRRNRNPWQT